MAQLKRFPKKRQDEIRFRRSLLRFTIVFSVIFVCGLSGRYFLNRIAVKDRLQQLVRPPKDYTLKWYQPEVRLRDGFLPAVALFLPRVELNHQSCATRRWSLQNSLIKLQVWSLLTGEPQIAGVRVGFLSGQHSQSCGLPGEEIPVESSAVTTAKAKKALDQALDINPWPEIFSTWKETKNTKAFRRFRIDNFDVQILDQSLSLMGSLAMRWNDKLSAVLDIETMTRKNILYQDWRPQLELELTDHGFKAEVLSSLREGQLQGHFSVENSDNYTSQLSFDLSKIPLAALLSPNSSAPQLQYLWLSCKGNLKSPWSQFQKDSLVIGDCEFDGPYGRVVLQDPVINLKGVESFSVEFQALDMDQVIEDKRDMVFSGVLSRYGQLDGQLSYKQPKLTFNGFLKNTEVIFSNSNRREVQKVKTLPFAGYWDGQEWSVKTKGIELDPGELSGGVEFKGQVKNKKSQGQLTVHKLLLDPKIYNLMLESELAELILYGRWAMTDGHLERWNLTLAAPELKSEYYQFKNLKIKGQGHGEEPANVRINAATGSVPKDSILLTWLRPTHLEKDWQSDPLAFSEFSLRLEMLGDRALRWKRGYARLKNGWQLSSEGARDKDKNWQAWLQWDQPNGRALRWNFLGPVFAGQWTAETPWLQAWLADHPDFVSKHKSIAAPQKAEQETITEKINNVGKKAIEKAKDLLKPDSKNEGS